MTNLTSMGDLAQSHMMRRHVAEARQQMNRLLTEVSTGQSQDAGDRLGGDFTTLAGLDRSLSTLSAYKAAGAEAAILAGTTQNILGSIQDTAVSAAQALIAGASSGDAIRTGTLATESRQAFGAVITALNGQVAGRSLFAGAATDGAATGSADTILMALEAAVAGLTSADDIAAAVTAWFDAGATGYGGTAYQGSAAPPAAMQLGEGTTAQLAVTADDPVLRKVLAGLATGAILSSAALTGQQGQVSLLARSAGEALLTANTAMADPRAGVGTVEEAIDTALTANATETSALQQARLSLLSVDEYEAATALTETETQLKTLYALTARLSQLSLAEYL